MRNTVISLLLTSLVGALAGCINADPSNFARDAGDAGTNTRPDVIDDIAPDGDPNAACKACLETPEDPGPGCAGALAKFLADPKGPVIYECGFRRNCWSLPMQSDIVSCGFPCFTEAGVTSFGDPVIDLGLAVVQCVLGPCHPTCGANP